MLSVRCCWMVSVDSFPFSFFLFWEELSGLLVLECGCGRWKGSA